MFLYAATIFVGAFLLFQVQPLIAKMILPWYGGGAMVWTSCMLFFQMLLLGGYGYSHAMAGKAIAEQFKRHAALIALSLLALPIIPKAFLKPSGDSNPLVGILLVLFISVGLPYFILSTTGPLLQSWFALRFPGRSPYRLFALSNFASLLALIGYPTLVEPAIPLHLQGWVWSGAYVLFGVLCVLTARATRDTPPTPVEVPTPKVQAPVLGISDEPISVAPEPAPVSEEEPVAPTWRNKLAWAGLAACASILLLSITNHLTQNVAAIPFLWVVPLALYLLSFMLTFDSSRWYNHWAFAILTPATLGLLAYPFWRDLTDYDLRLYVTAYCAGLLICCMFCHGEVARRKPHPKFLTGFYLMISIGGAVGGFCVSVLAPLLLPFHFEFSIGLAITAFVAMMALYRESFIKDVIWAGMTVFLIVTVYKDVKSVTEDHVVVARNLYGSLRVRESGSDLDGSRLRTLVNGTINHGAQYINAKKSRIPTTYYGEKSGVGLSILETDHPGMKVGVIGLGTGTLATYGKPGGAYKIYEINPLVVDIARGWFTYLKQCEAKLEIVMGDARLSLEREAPNGFDVLAVDAFSSDAIPVHLLTKEAVELYFRHIQPSGIVAIHVSNKYLSLYPVVQEIATRLGKAHIYVDSRESGANEQFSADWVLLANSAAAFDRPAFRAAASRPAREFTPPFWTDDYSNLFRIIR